MRIAHISDLHLSIKYRPWSYSAIKKLLRVIVEAKVDHLVITGDLTDNAEEHDFITFRNLLKTFGLLDSSRTSIVIGNHDIFGGPQTAQDIFTFPTRCANTDYEEKIRKFSQYFFELFENCYLPLEGKVFPFVKELEGHVLIGINTIDEYSRLRNPFASNGHISKEEKAGLAEIFKKFAAKKKIILAHHHFYKNRIPSKSSEIGLWNRIENFTMKLRGKKKILKSFVENKVEMILHGHSHEMNEYYRKGIRVLNAGGTFDQEEKKIMKLFLIDILPFDTDTTLETIPFELTLPQVDFSSQLIETLAG